MLLENGRYHSVRIGTTRLRNFCWSRSTSGTAWIIPPFLKFSGAVSSTEEQHTSVYQISMRFQALFCLRVFCIELKILHPSLFTVHIPTSGSGIKLKHLIPEDSEIMIACSQGDTSRVWKLLTSRRANVNDITKDNQTPLMVILTHFSIDQGSKTDLNTGRNRERMCKPCFTTSQCGSKCQRKLRVFSDVREGLKAGFLSLIST